MIIHRNKELSTVKKLGPWIYIYGRRKTGKTFFVKNFLKWDEYFFVKKDKSVLDKDENELTYDAFFEIFKRTIGAKKIVIDEFHRLPEGFFDYLHSIGVKGELIAISSTLWYSKKLLSEGSPLLGLFSPVCFSLVNEQDMLASLKDKFKGKELIEAAVYLREPWLLPKFGKDMRKFLPTFLKEHKIIIKALIGEIFNEEERQLSLVYEGILKSIACGKNISTEISSYLFSKKLIPKDNPGLIQSYLHVLCEIGLIERIEVYNMRKFRYYHTSPVLDLHFYLSEKYEYTELDTSEDFIKKVVDIKLPFHVERFFANALAKKMGLKKTIIESPELDVVLVEFSKIKAIAEVKWKRITPSEVRQIEETLEQFKVQKYIIVPDKSIVKSNLKVLDYRDFL